MRLRVLGIAAVAIGAAWASDWDDLSVREQENIERTFPATKKVDVDNFDGSVTVLGADTHEIKVEIHKTIRARSPEKVQEAKQKCGWIWGRRRMNCGCMWMGRFAASAGMGQ